MFGIGFSELVVIALVALIVVGPERLPKVARSLAILLGRAQRFASDLKSQVEHDLQLEELKQLKSAAENAMSEAESSVQAQIFTTDKQLREIPQSVSIELEKTGRPLEKAVALQSPASITLPATNLISTHSDRV